MIRIKHPDESAEPTEAGPTSAVEQLEFQQLILAALDEIQRTDNFESTNDERMQIVKQMIARYATQEVDDLVQILQTDLRGRAAYDWRNLVLRAAKNTATTIYTQLRMESDRLITVAASELVFMIKSTARLALRSALAGDPS